MKNLIMRLFNFIIFSLFTVGILIILFFPGSNISEKIGNPYSIISLLTAYSTTFAVLVALFLPILREKIDESKKLKNIKIGLANEIYWNISNLASQIIEITIDDSQFKRFKDNLILFENEFVKNVGKELSDLYTELKLFENYPRDPILQKLQIKFQTLTQAALFLTIIDKKEYLDIRNDVSKILKKHSISNVNELDLQYKNISLYKLYDEKFDNSMNLDGYLMLMYASVVKFTDESKSAKYSIINFYIHYLESLLKIDILSAINTKINI